MVTVRRNQPEPTEFVDQLPAEVPSSPQRDESAAQGSLVRLNLPNPATLHDRLGHAIVQAKRQGRGLALLILDVDRFASVNTTYGRNIGDQLLQAVADRVVQCVRAYDTVAHLGGDSFAILLSDAAEAMAAATVARRLMKAFTAPFAVAGQQVELTLSVGISLYPTNGEDDKTLLRYAEIAMYCAKAHSRNTYQFFTPALTVAEIEQGVTEKRLLKALSAHELVLFYEPRINPASGKMSALDVHVRWNHPQQGWLEPAAFMPAVAKTDVIAQIDRWMVQAACAQLQTWFEAGLPRLAVSVPLSERSLIRPSLTQEIEAILHEYALAPHQLELMLTMDVVIQHPARSRELFNDLHNLGVRCMVAGFGTEHTWFGAITKAPVDVVKINLGLVEKLTAHPTDAVVAALIALAHSLNLAVVVEGVDSDARRLLLDSHQPAEIQGEMVGRAVPAAICEAMYLRHRKFLPIARPLTW